MDQLTANNIRIRLYRDVLLYIPKLVIEEGELYIIIGPNGSGKSTLARALCGLHPITDGVLRFASASLPVLVWQTLELFPGTAQKNFQLIRDARHRIRTDDPVTRDRGFQERVESATQYFGIQSSLNKCVSELSGGERQLVAILRSFLTSSQMIILDEPTSSLDVVAVDKLSELIGSFSNKSRYDDNMLLEQFGDETIIVITHDERFVSQLGRYDPKLFVLEQTHERQITLFGGVDGRGLALKELYQRPTSLFVADFFKYPNILGYRQYGGFDDPAQFCSRDTDPGLLNGWVIINEAGIAISSERKGAIDGWLDALVLSEQLVAFDSRIRLRVQGFNDRFELTLPRSHFGQPISAGTTCSIKFNLSDKDLTIPILK